MSIYTLKPRFQSLLRPAARVVHVGGITANQVTAAACIGSLALGALLVSIPEQRWLFLLLPIWFLVRMAWNSIDGMLAREVGQASSIGAYLTDLGDV